MKHNLFVEGEDRGIPYQPQMSTEEVEQFHMVGLAISIYLIPGNTKVSKFLFLEK